MVGLRERSDTAHATGARRWLQGRRGRFLSALSQQLVGLINSHHACPAHRLDAMYHVTVLDTPDNRQRPVRSWNAVHPRITTKPRITSKPRSTTKPHITNKLHITTKPRSNTKPPPLNIASPLTSHHH